MTIRFMDDPAGIRNHGTRPGIMIMIPAIPKAAMTNSVVGGIGNNMAGGGAVRATVKPHTVAKRAAVRCSRSHSAAVCVSVGLYRRHLQATYDHCRAGRFWPASRCSRRSS